MRRYEDELDWDDVISSKDPKKEYKRILITLAAIIIVAIFLFIKPKAKETSTTNSDEQQTEQIAGQQNGLQSEEQVGTEVAKEGEEPVAILYSGSIPMTKEQTKGIDVAKYQGIIDWKKVADRGIDFAMVRVGYRSLELGDIYEDESARYNLQEATKYGIKVGAYFFSSAINKEEAIEEADFVANIIAQYPITYPVAYDCEGFETEKNRHAHLTKEERSEIAKAFMDRIYEHGYTPMLYGAKNALAEDNKWVTSSLEKHYSVWVSHYNTIAETDYKGQFAMWQYSNQGVIEGINGNVDLNIAYFGYEGVEPAHSSILPEQITLREEDLMNFEEVNEIVTAKNKTNLRDKPSQGEDSNVIHQLVNGETALRTGISKKGWSRVEYEGATYYAVSSYLTTDLSAPAQQDKPVDDDGIKTEFTSCNDTVTAKIEVNLRTLPSVTMEESTVVATLYHGETVIRTGINNEYGWSRVQYNGQTLYCISSYLELAE